jgi:hypothetical protein
MQMIRSFFTPDTPILFEDKIPGETAPVNQYLGLFTASGKANLDSQRVFGVPNKGFDKKARGMSVARWLIASKQGNGT